jgi:hypothetical protein
LGVISRLLAERAAGKHEYYRGKFREGIVFGKADRFPVNKDIYAVDQVGG